MALLHKQGDGRTTPQPVRAGSGRFGPGTGEVNRRVIARALCAMGHAGPVPMAAFGSGTPETAPAAIGAAFTN